MTEAHSRESSVDEMTCREATATLWEYLDGELGAERAAQWRWHAAACPSCRARQQGARAFLRAVQGTRHADTASPTLRSRVNASLRAHGLLA